ncbi:MAG: hypothetical protein M3O09_15425 [Acidobacteriota bacterium]|nr:hypothetical protein [Acidobacteriota bacterium]
MDNQTLLSVSIAVTAAAVVLQAGILVAMYFAVRKTTARIEVLSTEVTTKIIPSAEIAHSMLLELRPKVETVISNISESTSMIRAQLERVDATVSDVVDRTRLQVIRADELFSRTMDKVERTTEIVQKTVVSPFRQISGLVNVVTAGFQFFMDARRRGVHGTSLPQEELFI